MLVFGVNLYCTGYWDQTQGRPTGPPNNWHSKPSTSWSGDSSAGNGSNWGQSQSNSAGNHGSWGDSSSSNTWQAGGGSNRKPSFSWDESQGNGGDFGRDRRGMVSKLMLTD